MQIEKPKAKKLLQFLAAATGSLALAILLLNIDTVDPFRSSEAEEYDNTGLVPEESRETDEFREFQVLEFSDQDIVVDEGMLNRGADSSDTLGNTDDSVSPSDEKKGTENDTDEVSEFAIVYTHSFDTAAFKEPDPGSDVVGKLSRGTELRQVAVNGDYSLVIQRQENNELADYYVETAALTQDFVYPEFVTVLYNHVDGSYTHTEDTVESPVPANLELGEPLEVIGRTDEWYEIVLDDGQTAYTKSWNLLDAVPTPTPAPTATPVPTAPPAPTAAPTSAPAPAPASATAVTVQSNIGSSAVNVALSMQGPRGSYDCSSFVQEVYRRIGVSVPRSTSGYGGSGQNVSWANIQVGDLILYDSLGVGYTTHVAIYVGNNNVVHVNTVQGRIMVQNYRLGGGSYPITGIKRYR